MTSVGVIAHTGKRLGGGLPELRKTLSAYGIDDPPWREVPKSKHVPAQVDELADRGVDLLFVWGGDGTVQRAVDALAGRPVTVAILPAGTANLLATNLRLPEDVETCVRIGLHGPRRTLDVGKINGEHFAVMAGAGLDALMIRDSDGLKDSVGRLAYVWTGVKNVRLKPISMKIDVDGAPWFRDAATCVLVGNVGDVLGGLSVFPDARPDDGRLQIGVVTAHGAIDWARTLGRALSGDVTASPFVQTTSGTSFEVRMKERVPYELDGGDRKARKKLRIKVKPAAITVCVPEEATA